MKILKFLLHIVLCFDNYYIIIESLLMIQSTMIQSLFIENIKSFDLKSILYNQSQRNINMW